MKAHPHVSTAIAFAAVPAAPVAARTTLNMSLRGPRQAPCVQDALSGLARQVDDATAGRIKVRMLFN